MLHQLNGPERLDYLALRFHCRTDEGLTLSNPCSDLHGGFGLMLHAHFRSVYYDLLGAQADSGTVRAYVLRPGNALFGELGGGVGFDLDLLLFGAVVRHASPCAEALFRLGANGITQARQRFAIEHIERIGAADAVSVWSPQAGWNVRAMQPLAAAELLRNPLPAGEWRIELGTPLAIKHDNALLRSGLTPAIFFERLLGRAQLLATQQSGGPLLDPLSKQALLALASKLHWKQDETSWHSATRYSARQRQHSEFGGLLGYLLIDGDMGPLGGWLRLAEYLHVGSKTSFGYGRCHVFSAD